MMDNSPQQEEKDNGQEDLSSAKQHKILEHVNSYLERVRELYYHFLSAEQEHSRWLSTILSEDDETAIFLSNHAREALSRIVAVNKASLMITGANSSGKSTLINALVGNLIMPSGAGHVTSRVCKLSHSSWDDACIRFLRLNTENRCLEPHPDLESISLSSL